MPQILVPVSLKTRCPLTHFLALMQPTQRLADKVIRTVMPDWIGETTTRTWVGKDDCQAAGTWSLAACQGPASDYRADEHEPPRLPVGEKAPVLHAVVPVDRDSVAMPLRKAKPRVPKSYLPQYDPKLNNSPQPVREISNPALDAKGGHR